MRCHDASRVATRTPISGVAFDITCSSITPLTSTSLFPLLVCPPPASSTHAGWHLSRSCLSPKRTRKSKPRARCSSRSSRKPASTRKTSRNWRRMGYIPSKRLHTLPRRISCLSRVYRNRRQTRYCLKVCKNNHDSLRGVLTSTLPRQLTRLFLSDSRVLPKFMPDALNSSTSPPVPRTLTRCSAGASRRAPSPSFLESSVRVNRRSATLWR